MAQLFRYDNAFGFGCQMVQHSDNASFLIMSCFVATGALSSRRKPGFRGGVVRLLGVELRLPVLFFPKAEFNYQDSWDALAGNGKYCRRSALASVMQRVLADMAKRGARGSGVC